MKSTIRIILVLSLVALTSCGGPEYQPSSSLTVAIESVPTNLDPRLATDAASMRIIQLVYNGIMKWNEDYKLEKDLAESVKSLDRTSYLITLKPGIKFHHGRELTSQDVKFTIESILDPKLNSPNYSSFERLAKIEVLDKYRLKLSLKEPFSPFLSALTIGIVPEDLAGNPDSDLSRRPVGTGPFKFSARPNPDMIALEANPDYFGQQPKLSKLIIKVVPDDTVRVMELMSGAVDLIINAIPPDMIPVLEKDPNIRVETRRGTSYSYIGFNLKDPILAKPKVRQAIAHALDREGIIKHLLKGAAIPASGILPPDHWAYEGVVRTYGYKPEKARKLLDQAGYPDPPGPEPRFRLLYKTSQNAFRRLVGEALMAQLKEVGIKVTMRSYEWGTFFNDIKSGNFQLYSLTWVGITDPDVLYYIFHSQSVPPKGANRGRYSNLVVDRILTEARQTRGDRRRKAKYKWVQKILALDLPYVSLWYTHNVAAMRNEVQGLKLTPAGDFTPLSRVWLSRPKGKG